MKKKMKFYSILLVLALSALSCNLPGQDDPEQEMLNEDSIKTSVAATLDSFDQNDASAQLPDTTEEADTPDSVTPTATIDSTATPTETQEPTPTLSPTPPPSDPKLSLGTPDFKDSFNSTTNWTEHDQASSTTEIKDGKFFYTMHNPSPYSDEWVFSWPQIKDFYMEITAVTPASCSGKDRYGLIFRAPSYNNGYLFYLSCDGFYKLNKWDGSNMVSLEDWTFSDKIEAGPNKVNRLGIMTVDNDISLYVNGFFLTLIEDNDYMNEGYFGLLVAATDTSEFTVTFDDLMYWE